MKKFVIHCPVLIGLTLPQEEQLMSVLISFRKYLQILPNQACPLKVVTVLSKDVPGLQVYSVLIWVARSRHCM